MDYRMKVEPAKFGAVPVKKRIVGSEVGLVLKKPTPEPKKQP